MKTRFNEARAQKAVDFFEERLHLTKGRWAGIPFVLPAWQRDRIIVPVFGTERFDEELGCWMRLYRRVYIEVPKKNGKNPIGAALALQGLHADGEQSPEVYSIAAGKRQAGIVFGIAARMTKLEPALRRRTQILESKVAHHGVLVVPGTDGAYKVIPGDAAADDGINPSRVIVDEVHRIANRAMIDLIEESLAARAESLIVYLTTAGEDDPSTIAWELRDHADKVADGRIVDPYFFSFIRSATPAETAGDGWKDEALWRRVNPAIESFNPSMLTDLRDRVIAGEISPAKIATFKRLRLGVWLPPGVTTRNGLLDVAVWDRGAGMIDSTLAKYEGRELFGGLDMAASEDMAALSGVFPNYGGCDNAFCEAEICFDVILRVFVPAANLAGEAETWTQAVLESVREWVADGFVTVVDGAVIDDRDVHAVIDDWRTRFDLVELAKDPYQTKQLGIVLDEEGLIVYDHGPTMARMADPTEQFIRKAAAFRIHHGANPVLRWIIGNTLLRLDGYGNKRPDRKTSSGKIDGTISTILALACEERNRLEIDDGPIGFTIGGSA